MSDIRAELAALPAQVQDLDLDTLALAVQRLGMDENGAGDRYREMTLFLARVAEKYNLPGMFTVPQGNQFVRLQNGRARATSALPEYLRDVDLQPLADRDLIPSAKRAELESAGIVSDARTYPVEPPPNVGAAASAEPAPAPAASSEADPVVSQASAAIDRAEMEQMPLAIFANSGRGGLANDPQYTNAITELQTFLNTELGLDVGQDGPDGKYGPRTRAAVERFQGALTDVVQDGDAGPETIGKIEEIRRDMTRLQELINAINESALPVRFKSSLAQLLERDLTQAERTELENLISKYENFRLEFPEFKRELFAAAETAATGATDAARPTDTQAPNGPFVDGMVITDEVNERLQAIGRQQGIVGERLTAEDIAALNAAVADGTITNPFPVDREQPPIPGVAEPRSAAGVAADPDNTGNASDPEAQVFVQNTPTAARQLHSAAGWFNDDEDAVFRTIQGAVRNPADWERLQADFNRAYGEDLVPYLQGFMNSTEMTRYVWDPLANVGVPRPTNVPRRPSGHAGRNWDTRYGATHNPDGTLKTESIVLLARKILER